MGTVQRPISARAKSTVYRARARIKEGRPIMAILVTAMFFGVAFGDVRATTTGVPSTANVSEPNLTTRTQSGKLAPGRPVRSDSAQATAPVTKSDVTAAGEATQRQPQLGSEWLASKLPADTERTTGTAVPPPGTEAVALPTTLSVFRNTTVPTSGNTSTVGEPSTDQSGKNVFSTGNWHAEYSNNNGSAWSQLNPFTIFGSGFCCDQVTAYDAGRNRQYWMLQYEDHFTIANSAANFASWCPYSYSPSSFGRPVSESFDYSDIAIGTRYLYITSNVFDGQNQTATMLLRLSLDDMAACVTAQAAWQFRTDLATLKVAQGITDVAYAASTALDSGTGTTLRILTWPENSTTISTVNRAITAFAYMSLTPASAQGNCASQDGVVNNWCQRTDSRILGAARGNGKLWFSWNARQSGTSRPFPYTRIVRINEADLAVEVNSDLYSGSVAHLYTSISPDNRGHVGYVDTFGGGTGTSHYFPGGMVGVVDDAAPTFPGSTYYMLYGSGGGCLNPDGLRRWGDYNTARGWYTGDGVWTATVFARTSNNEVTCGTATGVVVRNVVFGRDRDRPTYNRFAGV